MPIYTNNSSAFDFFFGMYSYTLSCLREVRTHKEKIILHFLRIRNSSIVVRNWIIFIFLHRLHRFRGTFNAHYFHIIDSNDEDKRNFSGDLNFPNCIWKCYNKIIRMKNYSYDKHLKCNIFSSIALSGLQMLCCDEWMRHFFCVLFCSKNVRTKLFLWFIFHKKCFYTLWGFCVIIIRQCVHKIIQRTGVVHELRS